MLHRSAQRLQLAVGRGQLAHDAGALVAQIAQCDVRRVALGLDRDQPLVLHLRLLQRPGEVLLQIRHGGLALLELQLDVTGAAARRRERLTSGLQFHGMSF